MSGLLADAPCPGEIHLSHPFPLGIWKDKGYHNDIHSYMALGGLDVTAVTIRLEVGGLDAAVIVPDGLKHSFAHRFKAVFTDQ